MRVAILIAMVCVLLGCGNETPTVDMVLHEGAKYSAENDRALENVGSPRLSCHINVVVDCPAKTTADTLCNSLSDFIVANNFCAQSMTLSTTNGLKISFWSDYVYPTMIGANVPRIYLCGGSAIGMVNGKPVKVMQREVSDLLPEDICVERELSWICQWDVTVDELIRVSTIAEKEGYTKFYIGMVLGRIQDLPIEEFYED